VIWYVLHKKGVFVKQKPVELPRTGHEVLMRMFPFLDKMVAEDAAYIQENHPDLRVISKQEDMSEIPNGFEAVFDAYLSWNARNQSEERGLTPEDAERQFRAYMASAPAESGRMAQSLGMHYDCSLNFRLNGEKVFYVTDPLAERLAHTEANLRCALLALPFPSFQVIYTSKLAIDLYYNHIGAEGQRIGDRKGIDYEAPLSVFIKRLPSRDLGTDSLLITTLQAREVPRSGPMIYAISSRQLHLDPDWDIEAAIRTDWNNLRASEGVSQDPQSISPTSQDDAVFYQEGYAYYRMVMNTLLYLTSKGADLETMPPASQQLAEKALTTTSSKERKRTERRAKFASDAPFECLGRSVQPIGFGEGSDRRAVSSASLTHGKIDRRFLVRGHWRSQPVGPKREERRTIFIEPYYKGPDMAEAINRPYLVRKHGRRVIGDDDID
jgi:hypothetical protein